MKLNKFNYDNEEENIQETKKIKNEKRKKEKIKNKEKIKKKYIEEEKEEEEEEEEEENEREDEKKEEEEEENEEDNNKKKMIKKGIEPKKKGIKKFENKKFYFMVGLIILGILLFLITLIIFIGRSGKNKMLGIGLFGKNNGTESNSTKTNEEVKLDENQLNQVKTDLTNAYNNGELNVIKFYEDNINKKSYIPKDTNSLNNIHIAIGFTENNIDTIIKHLASAIQHASQSSFLHIHIMDADTFTYESLIKFKNLIYKINNNTEIIIYNASNDLKSFTIKEGGASKLAEYAKLYAFKAIKNIHKVIFLDGDDCMVQKDLNDLYVLDMNDIFARGIAEYPSIRNPSDWMDKYLSDKSHYINTGVILVNLELCQKEGIYDKAKELNNNEFYTKTEEPFQDIINVLMRRKIEFFHPKYNKINFYESPEDKSNEEKWYPWVKEALKQSEKNNHMYTKEELMEADNDPVVIHYAWEKQLNKMVRKYEEDKKSYAQLVGLS